VSREIGPSYEKGIGQTGRVFIVSPWGASFKLKCMDLVRAGWGQQLARLGVLARSFVPACCTWVLLVILWQSASSSGLLLETNGNRKTWHSVNCSCRLAFASSERACTAIPDTALIQWRTNRGTTC